MNKIIDDLQLFFTNNTGYVNYAIIGIIGLIFVFVAISLVKKKKIEKIEKQKQAEIDDIVKNNTPTERYNYNAYREYEKDQIKGMENKIPENKKKKLNKKQRKIEEERDVCIQLYNYLYNYYYKEHFSVDLSINDTLRYYYNAINESQTFDDLKLIETQLSSQTSTIIEEVENNKMKIKLEEERKILYDSCVIKIRELEYIYRIIKTDGSQCLKSFNDKLLGFGMFSNNQEYQLLYNDLIQTINYITEKNKSVLEEHGGENFKEVDLKLVESLKELNCDINERDLKKIKKNYIALIRQYHPDKNIHTSEFETKTRLINNAWTYVQNYLTQ